MFDLILGKSVEVEKKSYFPSSFSALLAPCGIFSYSDGSSEFLRYYQTNSAVATAVKILSDGAIDIPFVVRDKKTGKFIYDHPVLALLAKPNPFTTAELFESELVGYYILTGNNYLNVIGSLKPSEIYNLSPNNITIQPSSNGYPSVYTYQSAGSGSQAFKITDGKFVSNQSSELFHLKNFNPNSLSYQLYGVSELKSCEVEIALHTLANIHNHSLLKNQARPSGLITYKGDSSLSDEQIESITKTLRDSLAGAGNSGKATFLSGDFNWTQLSESMKDMDFATLYRRTAESIYNTLRIPLPLVSPDNMTLANMDTAKLNLYDNAVIPLKRLICSFLTKSLMPKYKQESLEITFDESEIETLKSRETNNALAIAKAGILTRDEIRASIGYDPMKDGTGGQIVGGQQTTTAQEVKQSTGQEKAELKHLLQCLKDKDGSPLYSDEFINETVK